MSSFRKLLIITGCPIWMMGIGNINIICAYLCEFEYVLAITMAERNIFRSMDIYILDYGSECAWSKPA